MVEFDITPNADGTPATIIALGVGRTPNPQHRDAEALKDAETAYMLLVAGIMEAEGRHTGQGTTTGNGSPWDFELTYPDGRRGLGDHVLYTDPNTNEAPEQAAFMMRHAAAWDPDGDFRKVLASPAVAKHIRRLTAWHSDPDVSLDESHLVIETHSVVPAVELIDVWEHQAGHALEPLRSTLTRDEVGDVTYIWVVTERSPNMMVLAHGLWVPVAFGEDVLRESE
ncbi:hypothetical protein [Microlunatus antarcticus]|uniref:Uncharacterized protein n=1 Tax=Microlunatus antarcticus TaxID=53388 RepID=A0A7W5JW73_9ACTN|nr:hypothetical protein [Microlunatus antarcticus]MBB3327462.1 hypothetical protein [Microlunatus antarcticus]